MRNILDFQKYISARISSVVYSTQSHSKKFPLNISKLLCHPTYWKYSLESKSVTTKCPSTHPSVFSRICRSLNASLCHLFRYLKKTWLIGDTSLSLVKLHFLWPFLCNILNHLIFENYKVSKPACMCAEKAHSLSSIHSHLDHRTNPLLPTSTSQFPSPQWQRWVPTSLLRWALPYPAPFSTQWGTQLWILFPPATYQEAEWHWLLFKSHSVEPD